MKRLLPVLLGAVAGAIGLPLVMQACWLTAIYLFPTPSGLFFSTPQEIGMSLGYKVMNNVVQPISTYGFVLGAASVVLGRSARTFWPRALSAICSTAIGAYLLWSLRDAPKFIGYVNPIVKGNALIYAAAYYLPLLIWTSALFFFAVLARPRNFAKPPQNP